LRARVRREVGGRPERLFVRGVVRRRGRLGVPVRSRDAGRQSTHWLSRGGTLSRPACWWGHASLLGGFGYPRGNPLGGIIAEPASGPLKNHVEEATAFSGYFLPDGLATDSPQTRPAEACRCWGRMTPAGRLLFAAPRPVANLGTGGLGTRWSVLLNRTRCPSREARPTRRRAAFPPPAAPTLRLVRVMRGPAAIHPRLNCLGSARRRRRGPGTCYGRAAQPARVFACLGVLRGVS